VTSEMRVEQRAEVVVYPTEETDDFDPDALTALLGITPTKLYRKGEVLESGRVRPFSAWMWETAERAERDSERLVQEILDKFEAVAIQLASARSRWGLDLQVGLVISMYGSIEVDPHGASGAAVSTPALYFSSQTLRRLSELGCSLDIDTYVCTPE
jgi:hypothetical protein